MAAKVRLDALLADRGLYPSRTVAARAVRAGEVQVGTDGPIAAKPGMLVEADAGLGVRARQRYASRGGEKLENALTKLGVDPGGRVCLDIGASAGGFTDCLLQHGAAKVFALDVASGQLEDRLRRDPRVIEMARFNARELTAADLPERPGLVTIDVSFISLTKVLPAVAGAVAPDGQILAMVKPQFELTRSEVRGGVVRDPALREKAVVSVAEHGLAQGWRVAGAAYSGLAGPKGNRETFICFSAGGDPNPDQLTGILAGAEI